MRILIVYASNSGNTRLTAQRIASGLAADHRVTIKEITDATVNDLAAAELLVLGSCSWLRKDPERGSLEGELPEHAYQSVEGWRTQGLTLGGKPVAVFGLGRHEYTKFCGAVDHLERLVEETGGRLVVDSLRIDGFPHHQETLIDEWAGRLTAVDASSSFVER